jgi:transketolase
MNAAHYKLGNLVAIIDYNGLEADGSVNEITGLGDIGTKYKEFGWNVKEVNGNSIEEVKIGFDSLPSANSDCPTIFICHTIKGKGVSFMENQAKWHAGKITKEQYEASCIELEEKFRRKWEK